MPFKIVEVHVFIATDADGTEGVIGKVVNLPDIDGPVFMPFVMADRARLESLRPHAEEIARVSGERITLARFTMRQDVEVIIPRPAFTCPTCGAVSYNPHDLEHRYCGRCHQFHEAPC